MRCDHYLAQVFLAEFLLQGLDVRRRQESACEQKEIEGTTDENGGGNGCEIKEADGVPGSLAKELADNDIAAGANKGPLPAKSSPVGGAKEIARRGEVALLTDA
jgi:hypothetical protein